ncbi:MAG: FprA family A-type flavoprotein [Rikenellaceae bacterium]|nr:FprA family A-type flavoprotein [Rikenellaceae bacterium]
MKAITYIGVDDTDLDLFEGLYTIPNGISYNSYLIVDEKVAIIDSVDIRKCTEWLANLKTALADRTPDYIVVHHMEPDHAGSLAAVVERYPNIKLVCTARAQQMLSQFFDGELFSQKCIVVGEGDNISLGEHTLTFYMAPMVHWPEVMVSYESKSKVLFSADAFGKFGALSHNEEWACEARRYYFNICGKYGVPVQTLLKKVAKLDVAAIYPLHGPLLTENLEYYIGLYDCWSKYEVETAGVFIAYASIYGGTAAVAEHFAQMLRDRGIQKITLADLCRDDKAEAVEDAFRMGTLVLAAASYDGDVFPPMHEFLHHLQLKGFRSRRVAIIENGSWAPCAARAMMSLLEPMKEIEVLEPVVTIRSRMKPTDIPALERLADAVVG